MSGTVATVGEMGAVNKNMRLYMGEFVGESDHPKSSHGLCIDGGLKPKRLNTETSAMIKDISKFPNGLLLKLWDNVAARDRNVVAGIWETEGVLIKEAREKIENEMKNRGVKFDFMFYYRMYKRRKEIMKEREFGD